MDKKDFEICARWVLTGELITTVRVNLHDFPGTLMEVVSQKAKAGCSIQLLFGSVPLDKYSTLEEAGLTDQSVVDVVLQETDELQAQRLTCELSEAQSPSQIQSACSAVSDFLSTSCGDAVLAKRRDVAHQQGIIQAVLDLLRFHRECAVAQEACWCLLSKLTSGAHEGIKSFLLHAGIAGLLQTALQEHPTERKLRKAAGIAVNNVCRGRWSRYT